MSKKIKKSWSFKGLIFSMMVVITIFFVNTSSHAISYLGGYTFGSGGYYPGSVYSELYN